MFIRLTLVLLTTLLASGCGSLNVTLEGTLQTQLIEPAASSPTEPVVLAFNRLGHLSINGKVLDLPTAAEERRFGLRVVEADALPPLWRPDHAREGGVLVSSLDKASPLAIGGLRLFDRIRSLDGKPVKGALDLVRRLDAAGSKQVRLDITKPDARKLTITTQALVRVGESNRNHVPLMFEQQASSTGHSLGVGPLDSFFYYRTRTRHLYQTDRKNAHSAYRERFEWGAFANAFLYQRERDLETGEERSRLRLFWLIDLGDDLNDAEDPS